MCMTKYVFCFISDSFVRTIILFCHVRYVNMIHFHNTFFKFRIASCIRCSIHTFGNYFGRFGFIPYVSNTTLENLKLRFEMMKSSWHSLDKLCKQINKILVQRLW